MDTITHGIAGALVGKAFFADGFVAAGLPRREADAERGDKPPATTTGEKRGHKAPATTSTQMGRVAIWAATLGGLFPDSDAVLGLFDVNGMAVISAHRGVTHSFLCLPLWALALAALTRWFCRRHEIACPSFAALTGIYAAGIALHIFLDLITSFGTMIWSPLSAARVSLDLAFIIDLALTSTVLLPQVAAWVHRERITQTLRALFAWGSFTLAAFAVRWMARLLQLPFSRWVAPVAALIFAALFFLPLLGRWGNRVPRRAWCRAGVLALAAYLGACFFAHRAALGFVEDYAARENLRVDAIAAIPLPTSLLNWSGLIRTADGVHFATIHLFAARAPKFGFSGDAADNPYIAAARQLPEVQSYFRFARFPVVRFHERGGVNVVEFVDLRFFGRTRRGPQPFTFRVVFDAQGGVISSGWAEE
ncbi:MAG: metal-dependent hydrolase [Acidobacteria bacterium]|nr:metal-dependent hydrolase [Acidobacteriota bacterium]